MNNLIQIINFFKDRGFSFGSETSDIRRKDLIISEDQSLTNKLLNKVFAYVSPESTNTSFYVLNFPLSAEEMYKVRRHIWNENKYDLFFSIDKNEGPFIATLFYAKASPKDKDNTIKIASFSGDENDSEKIEAIKKWKFESGSFWLSFSDFLTRINKIKRIDIVLIDKLKELKIRLFNEVKENDTEKRNEIVQALIDRTLFIKYLEDNCIINSGFYKHYFGDDKFNYKKLLENNDVSNINKLFYLINTIFNNFLFKKPSIEDDNLSKNITILIAEMISQKNWNDPQLSLFDFRFDVIPVEFISHIYEAFLENEQIKNGIFYTPKKLAQLIVDDTITTTGSVLDPSCGSGMFLVLAFRKLLEFEPVSSCNIAEIIEHKNRLVKYYIFGIEKKDTACRIALFSLYLELLSGIKPDEIKKLIKDKLTADNLVKIFPYDFSENIITANSFEIEDGKIPHKNKTYDFMVGNPPFLKIDRSSQVEHNFIEKYQTTIDGKTLAAKDVVGYKQISQCFMLKIKDWAKANTRFGFVINSSNFYNEESLDFQTYFFQYYKVEKFYELSKVKEILFPKSRESVSVLIFSNNKMNNNTFDYYSVEPGIFSEFFKLLIIKEDRRLKINQLALLNEEIKLRDYLIGNEFDRKLLFKLSDNKMLGDHILKDKSYRSFRGLGRVENTVIADHFKIDINELSREEKNNLHERFAKEKYLNSERTDYYNTPYIFNADKVIAFRVNSFDGYINENNINKDNFSRPRNKELFDGNKILFNRYGKKIKAAFVSYKCFFSTYLYVIKLQDHDTFPLFTAILNSDLVNYFLSLKYCKRINDNFSKLDTKAIKSIPVPKQIDSELKNKIMEISQKLSNGYYKYEGEIENKLNNLIYDLYDLSYLEKTRINDFFSEKREVSETDLGNYKKSLIYSLEIYFESEPVIETYQEKSLPFGLVVAVIYFNKAIRQQPTGKNALRFTINEILKENPKEKFLAMREKIYGNDCIYIVKNNQYQSWTITKAYEDGQEILKRLRG